MDIKPIKTKRDYEAALRAIEPLMSAKRNTPEGDKLDVLVTLIEAYEPRHFPLGGCKGAIAKIVGDNSADGRGTLDRLAKVGRLDLALEHVLVRHSTEFDKAVVAKASRNLSQYNKSS